MTATLPSHTGPDLILGLSSAYLTSRALHVVAEFGVADALGDEPTDTETLAAAAAADPDALDRVMRLLEAHGVFASEPGGRWRHTPASRALRSDDARSMRSYARMVGSPPVWESFTALGHTLRTGESGIHTLHSGGLWGYLQDHPDDLAVFDAAMTDKARGDVEAVLAAHDFSRYRRVADIGGGRGHLIAGILASTATTTGVLFDLSAVAAQTEPGPRLDVTTGDFFADPLPNCDAYLLMHILHDWDDADAVRILDAVARAGRPSGATVLLLECVLPDSGEPHPAKTLDVMMLATTGGRERTIDGYRALLDGAGIDLLAANPTASPMCILECRVL